MKIFNNIKRKCMVLYMIIGILYVLFDTHILIWLLMSNDIVLPGWLWRYIGEVIALICIIFVSLYEKKQNKKNYVYVFLRGMLITFVTSYLFGFILLIYEFILLPSAFDL